MQILQHLAAKAVATSTYPSLTTLASNIVAFPTSNPNTFDGPYFPDNLNVAPSATSTLTPDDPTVWYEQDWVLVMTIMLVIFSLVSAMLCLWASASSTVSVALDLALAKHLPPKVYASLLEDLQRDIFVDNKHHRAYSQHLSLNTTTSPAPIATVSASQRSSGTQQRAGLGLVAPRRGEIGRRWVMLGWWSLRLGWGCGRGLRREERITT